MSHGIEEELHGLILETLMTNQAEMLQATEWVL